VSWTRSRRCWNVIGPERILPLVKFSTDLGVAVTSRHVLAGTRGVTPPEQLCSTRECPRARPGPAEGAGAHGAPAGQITTVSDARFDLPPLPVPVLEPFAEGYGPAEMAECSDDLRILDEAVSAVVETLERDHRPYRAGGAWGSVVVMRSLTLTVA
jgi:hypothetical protein